MSNKMLHRFDSNDFSDTRLDYVLFCTGNNNWEAVEKLIQDLKERNATESRIGKIQVLVEKINNLQHNEKEDLFDACFQSQCDQCSRDYSEEEIREKEREIEDLEDRLAGWQEVVREKTREINDLENSFDNCQEENKNLQYKMDELLEEIQNLKDDNKVLADKVSDLETEIGNLEDYIRDNAI